MTKENYDIEYQRVLITMSLLQEVEDSNYTKNHSLRVGRLVKEMCEELNIKKDKLLLTRSAYLHDVGKIKLNKKILFKVGRLTNDEYEEMKTHVKYGYDILKSMMLNDEAEIVLQHHERLDGSGYPNGISGNEYTEYSQILSVVDVYDAILTERPYKEKKSPTEVLLYLYSIADKHFSLKIIKALHSVLEKNKKIKKVLDI